jgi:ferric-chelate reductase
MASRKVKDSTDKEAAVSRPKSSTSSRIYWTAATLRQRYLLPEIWPNVFGHVSRLQVTVLAVILGYLLVFS